MANRVTIDVEARFVDNVTNPAHSAEEAISDVTSEVDRLNRRRANPRINADTRNIINQLDNTQRRLDRINHSRVRAVIDAVDNASRSIERVTDTAKRLTKNTWTALVNIKDQATAPLKKIYNSLFNIKTLIGTIVAGAAIKQLSNTLVTAPLSVADQYSSAKIGFSTLLGAERGQQMMDDLDQFAKATPFNTSGVIAASQKMLAMGWDAENIIADMKTIGDAAAATGKGTEGLDRIVLALSQIRSKGKLSTEELNQLAEAGISAKRYIAEGLGYGSGDKGLMAMTKDLEGGKIGAEAGIQAIIEGMKEYNGMMDKTANETVSGLKAQLEDTFEINLVRRWGQGIQDGAKKGLGSVLALLDQAEGALQTVGDLLYDLGSALSGYVAKALDKTVERVKEITGSDAFKNADLGGKIKMLWEGALKNPFQDWWAQTVKPWWDNTFVPWAGDKAVSLGISIAKGIATGLKELFTALPAWAQVLLGGYGAAKAFTGINGLIQGGISAFGLGKSLIGATGNSMVAGSGLLGGLANTGYALTGGAANAAGYFGIAGGMSGGMAALAGLGGIAGGVAGLTATFSGLTDLVKGYRGKDMTADQQAAYKGSGAVKIGGALAGAGAGALLGTKVGAIGGPLGMLLGAGIGGIAGMIGGKMMKSNAEKKMKTSELEANQAYKELERRQKLIAERNAQIFGTIKLSADEIKDIVDNLVIGDKAESMQEFAAATEAAKTAMSDMSNATGKLNRMNWKASLGFKFDETSKQQYLAAVQEYITNAENVVESQHYEFTAAVNMLLEPDNSARKGILDNANTYFADIQKELDGYTKELNTKVKLALDDGIIDESEAAAIQELMNKQAEIINKVTEAQSKAEMQTLQIKFSAGEIDYESFQKLQEEITKQLAESQDQYSQALTTSIASLNIQLEDGAITQDQYNSALQELTDGYTAKVDSLKLDASSIQFEMAGDVVENVLGPKASEILERALNQSLAIGIDPRDWTAEEAANFLGVKSLTEQNRLQISDMLGSIADTLPAETTEASKNSIVKAFEMDEKNVADLAHSTRGGLQSALEAATEDGFTISPVVNVTPRYNVRAANLLDGFVNQARGGLWGANIPGYANGGMVQGGGQLVRVAEEGTPEMIIPLGSQRRDRGMKLWAKAGEMLGADEGVRFAGSGEVTSGQSVQVEVGGITIEVNMADGNTNVAEAIKAQADEIAETVAGVLYQSFSSQFQNTPLRG